MSLKKKEINIGKFRTWASSKLDADYEQMVHRGFLNRKIIATECGFGPSALRQNSVIIDELKILEDQLRHKGVLPEIIDKAAAATDQQASGKKEFLKDSRKAELEEENAMLRIRIRSLEEAIKEFGFMDKIMNKTGRLIRK